MKKIALWEARHPKTVILIAVLLLIPSLIGFICTRVNYDIMSYLPDSIESVKGEQVLDKTFNNAGMSIIVFQNSSPKYISALKGEIEKMDAVSQVIWVDTLADIGIPQDILPDAITDVFYSEDGNSTMMLVQYKYAGSSDETLGAIKQIKTLMSKQTFISGLSAIVEDTKELTDREAPIYIASAVILALIAMSIMMESWILPFIILASMGIAILYNMGTNFVQGEISFITQSIAAILQLGVTMDYSVFLIDRYHEEKIRHPEDRTVAMANAVTKSFVALLGSSLTTVFGFLALCFMTFRLGLDIGLVMAKGVIFGILTVVLILPEMILLFENVIEKYKHKRHIPHFEKLNNFIFKHKAIFAIVFVILLIPCYLLQHNVPVYYNMDKAIPSDLVSVQGLNLLKSQFNMATTQFIIVDDSIAAGKLMEMEEEIKDLDGISSVLAYNDFIGPAIPDNIIPDKILDICKKDGKQLIMVNSAYSAASDELSAQLDKMIPLVKSYDPTAVVTGEGAITDDLIVTTNRDFMVTSILSIGAIFLLLMITFKSVSLPVLLILSIELAIWINLSISTIFGANISFVAPTIINCVQLGATVDYAVLLTTRFREEVQKGKPRKDAIIRAANAADQSIFQSAVVFFVATFGVYCISDISIVKEICALLARGSVISALSIIFFLTPLLYLSENVIGKTTLGWNKNKRKPVAADGVQEDNSSVNTNKEENKNA